LPTVKQITSTIKPSQKIMSKTLQTEESIYGNFWYRFVAVIIDVIIIGIAAFIFGIPLGMIFGGDLVQLQMASSAVSLLVYLMYGSILESSGMQGTIGKKVLNLKVTNIEGDALNFSEALVRNLVKYWSNILLVIVPYVSDIKPFVPESAVEPSVIFLKMYGSPYMIMTLTIGLVSTIGFLIAAFTPRRQALHDIVAKTAVLTTKSKSSGSDDEW
jgi:uncharacterized RDD family membrane protein YckC